jgi:Putative lumazine-binding
MISFRRFAFHLASLLICPAVFALGFAGMATGDTSKENSLTPEEKEVLEPLQRVLDGIASRNKDEVRNQLLHGGSATLIRNGQILQLSFDAFVDRIPGGTQKLEERIHDPQIRIDDDIAMIWAPYEFLIDGTVDHRGTDVVNLVRQNGRWLIAGIADNSRKVQSSVPPTNNEH